MSDEEITISGLALGERKFLHDLSNKLLIVQGMSTTLTRRLVVGDPLTQKELDKLQKVVNASEAMIEMLQSRRSLLHEIKIDATEKS